MILGKGTSQAFVVSDILLKSKCTSLDNNTCIRDFDDWHAYMTSDEFMYYPVYILYYDKPAHVELAFYKTHHFNLFDLIKNKFNVNWAEVNILFNTLYYNLLFRK